MFVCACCCCFLFLSFCFVSLVPLFSVLCLYICLSVCLSIFRSACPSVTLHARSSICLHARMSVHMCLPGPVICQRCKNVCMCLFFVLIVCLFGYFFLFYDWLSVCLSICLSDIQFIYVRSYFLFVCMFLFVWVFFFSNVGKLKTNSLSSFIFHNIQYLSIPKPISFYSLFLCLSVCLSVCLFVCLTFSLYLPFSFSLHRRVYFQCRQIHTNSPKKFRASLRSANCHFSQFYY